MSSEHVRLSWLKAFLGGGPREGIAMGVGDDAAVVRLREGESMVCTVDAHVDGVHFQRDWLTDEELGYRATMAAASDLAAMGARPFCALAALTLPSAVEDDSFHAIVRGQRRATDELDASIVGGNLARGTELSIATTWLGRVGRPIGRSGARPGDWLQVAGRVGAAHLGLLALQSGNRSAALEDLIRAWKSPRALVWEGLRMACSAHAAIDLSDGLSVDADRLAQASGVRIVLHENDLVREAALLRTAGKLLGIDPFDAVCFGGEDYALLVAAPQVIDGFRTIGRVERGEQGPRLSIDRGGRIEPLAARGFDHFAS